MADKKLPWGIKPDGLAPGSMKSISENKLKMFNIGSMNLRKGMTKREQEEAKKKEEEEAAAQVFQEFVASFDDAGKNINRAWVKGGTVNPDKKGGSNDKPTKTKLYRPTSKLAELASTFRSAKEDKKEERQRDRDRDRERNQEYSKPDKPGRKKEVEKKKTNLEMFKEELKMLQSEREERRAAKRGMGIGGYSRDDEPVRRTRFEPLDSTSEISLANVPPSDEKGGFNYDDTMTTNLYLGNINPKLSEQYLMELFGRFGPLASVKIMWPRSEEERARGRNCGFVAFMNRKDGERALTALQGKDFEGFEMKLGWGKAVPIPPHPIYIPPAMLELTLPPPPSGLPFNAQPKKSKSKLPSKHSDKAYGSVPPPDVADNDSNSQESSSTVPEEDLEKTLANAVVKVVIPTERSLLCIIHRMIEFVVREGPMFEAMIMNRELNNPNFRFLFENQSPAHVYYRWKLFSILQGDQPYKWRCEEFRMFKGGSVWRPPPLDPYSRGMPEELVGKGRRDARDSEPGPRKGQLSEAQRDRLEDLLRELTPERVKVGDAMVWCLDHADSAEEVVECITESLSILQTPIPKKIARLFLVSDILFNCSAKVANASYFRKYFESKLPEIFRDIHEAHDKIDARLKAEQFKQKVMNCFRAWEDWAVYPNEFLINLQNIFLGLTDMKPKTDDVDGTPLDLDGDPIEDVDGEPLDPEVTRRRKEREQRHKERDMRERLDSDVDGAPLDPDVDGVPLSEEIDGAPIPEEDVDGAPMEVEEKPKGGFLPSKWETIDKTELEAQAMTTSKWDLLEQEKQTTNEEEDVDGRPLVGYGGGSSDDDDGDENDVAHALSTSREGSAAADREAMTEERRSKLREIELKVMKYQDELEAGKRSRKEGMTLAQQLEHYRKKLLAKEEEKLRDKERERRREEERERVKEWERAREREREREREHRGRERGGADRERDWGDAVRLPGLVDAYESEEETYSEPSSYRRGGRRSGSSSPSPGRGGGSQRRGATPATPPAAYNSPSRKRRRSRSRSPKRRHRSKSPKRVKSPKRSKSSRSRSKSRSPTGRHKHKHRKSRH